MSKLILRFAFNYKNVLVLSSSKRKLHLTAQSFYFLQLSFIFVSHLARPIYIYIIIMVTHILTWSSSEDMLMHDRMFHYQLKRGRVWCVNKCVDSNSYSIFLLFSLWRHPPLVSMVFQFQISKIVTHSIFGFIGSVS